MGHEIRRLIRTKTESENHQESGNMLWKSGTCLAAGLPTWSSCERNLVSLSNRGTSYLYADKVAMYACSGGVSN